MKRVKRVLALLAAFALVLAMAVPAWAEGATYQLKVKASGENHTYKVYQIFTGEMSTNDAKAKVLSNVKWGKNGTEKTGDAVEAGTLTALESATGSDTEKLAVIKNYVNLNTDVFATLDSANNYAAKVPAGYYLVKDADNTLNGEDEAYTTFLVNVVGENVTLTPKSAKPSVNKFVQDEAADKDTDSNDSEGWGKTADHAINESFKFKLTATLPQDVAFGAYSTYKVQFTDTMSAGVTFESIDSVTVDGQNVTGYEYTATAGQAGGEWTLTINDIKSISGVNLNDGAEIVVVYNAHLNEKAYVNHEDGATTNENKVYLKYSNNPNASGSEELGKTPEENVWVFTYEVDNTKVKEKIDGEPLAGAGFCLYKDVECSQEVALIYDATLGAYRPTKTGETGVEMKSAENTGKFNIVGLDAGVYYMRETTTPTGYNTCDDVRIVINARHQKTESGNNVTFTNSGENASNLTNTIINNAGTTLPSTGGMGTAVFYVVGGGLMAVAVVLLVTKKRMENKR